nr:putative GED domain-containing protein DNM1P46 [Pan troglodytes]
MLLLRAAVQPVLACEREDTLGGVGRAGRQRSSSSQSCCPTCTHVGRSRHSWRSRQSRETKEFIFSELLSNLYTRGNEKTLLVNSAEQADQGVHLLGAAVQPVLAWEREDTPGGVGRAGRPRSSSSQSCCPTCTRVGTRRHSCRSRQSRHSGPTRCCFSEMLSNLYLRGNGKILLEESADQADQGVHLLGAAVQPVLAWE